MYNPWVCDWKALFLKLEHLSTSMHRHTREHTKCVPPFSLAGKGPPGRHLMSRGQGMLWHVLKGPGQVPQLTIIQPQISKVSTRVERPSEWLWLEGTVSWLVILWHHHLFLRVAHDTFKALSGPVHLSPQDFGSVLGIVGVIAGLHHITCFSERKGKC